MTKNRFLLAASIGVILFSVSAAVHATDTFTFAGYTFNQLNTPDHATLLGNNAVLGGATFSAGFPSTTTASQNFPQGGSGFNDALAIGRLTGLSGSGVPALNLPNNTSGVTTRRGVELYWSNSHGIPNLAGKDFVIYEAGSTSNTVEGLMVRARTNPQTDTWTDWFYFGTDSYQIMQFTPAAEVAFTYPFDLSDMGVAPNVIVDRIQMANLVQADRIVATNGIGKVVFDGSSTNMPNAGPFDSDGLFDSTTYDPDPLYLASLHDICEATAPTLNVSLSTNTVKLSWPAPTCYSLQSRFDLSTKSTWASAPETLNTT
ncbi:MAG TPA: hypothetical protein VM260_00780, partial [Pirellula sp.]|nr:hypothetical protein [Pirellula sp.]